MWRCGIAGNPYCAGLMPSDSADGGCDDWFDKRGQFLEVRPVPAYIAWLESKGIRSVSVTNSEALAWPYEKEAWRAFCEVDPF